MPSPDEGVAPVSTNFGIDSWYHATLVENKHMTGWINSIALIGQQIDRVE